ncbi:sulfite exporter TauE/SafE family protein [Sphingobium nicotianae]|uniref:Probable membrane transporter protein n=1 Tax=Sphingobium nicotianae TaxID=2782607 RepID=A0A9X1DCG4_9SPHN|nr:sulfite exporter TauE/SafE family protein [Sphingobium nicotianae]MBT2187310.1 sulfite exporter TauE/SafE family protein [Sphingobium nicotianae]
MIDRSAARPDTQRAVLTLALALVAALYASVGQAGGTGYLAVMGIAGIDPAVMKPTALALNVLVAAIATFHFWRAGRFSWRSFYPFGVLGFPFSLIGGAINLPAHVYYPVVGALLLAASGQMMRAALAGAMPELAPRNPPFVPALLVGACIGLLSGITGTGGGIFLAPVILMTRWVEMRRAVAVTAAYNLLNSAAALAGSYATLNRLPAALPLWLLVTAIGATAGAIVGSRHVPERPMRLLLALILLAAALKMLLA